MQSEVFFFISSVGFIVIGILVTICLIYIIHSMHAFSRIIDKVEKNIDELGDSAKEMIEEIRSNPVFRFFFKKKKRANKK